MGPGAAWRVLRTREFGFYFLGNALSASGGWFQNLAGALLIYRLTHSAFLLGVLNFSNFIPILVLAPWAGSIADRVDRRRLLLLTQTIAVGLAGGLALLRWGGAATPAVVIGFALALGVVSAFSAPAQQAFGHRDSRQGRTEHAGEVETRSPRPLRTPLVTATRSRARSSASSALGR